MHTLKFKTFSQNILLAIIAVLPILFLPLASLSLEPLKTFLCLFTGVVFMLGIILYKIKQDSFFVTKNAFVMALWGVVLSALVSSIFSDNMTVSFFGRQISSTSFFGLISLFALMFTVYTLFNDLAEKTRLFLVLYVSGVAVAVIHLLAVVVPFFPTLGFFVNNTINTVGRWYDLGFFALFIALSSVLVLQFLKHSKFYKIIGWIGFVSGMVLMILNNSMIVLIMAILFSLLYIVLNAITQHDFDIRSRVSYETLIILVVSVIFLLIGGKTGIIFDSVFQLQTTEVRPSVTATLEVSKQVLQHDLVAGVGFDRFDTAWLLYRPIGSNITQFWDTDFRLGYSNILSIAVTQGILGILAWLAFIGCGLYFAFKLLFVAPEQKIDHFIYTYSVLGFLFFLTVMLVYNPSVVLVALMFIFLGLFLSNLKHAGLIKFKEIQINQNPRISFAYILTLVLLLIGFVYVGYVQVSQYVSRILLERATVEYNRTGELETLESKVNLAQFVYHSDVYSRTLTEIGMMNINRIVQNKEISQEQAVSQFSETLRQTIGHAQAAIAYDPQSYVNRISLIKVYKSLIPLGVTDAKTEALVLLDATAQITPNNPTIALEKARIYALSREFDSAIGEIKNAIALKSNYIEAAFLLSQIQVEKGEIDEAVKSIQTAVQVDPHNPNLWFQLGLLYYNQEKFNDSVARFEQAVRISPAFANAKYFLGLSYYKNNRTSDAIKIFENLNAQVPESQEVQLILNNLKNGLEPFSGIQPPLDDTPEKREELPLDDTDPETGIEEEPEE